MNVYSENSATVYDTLGLAHDKRKAKKLAYNKNR